MEVNVSAKADGAHRCLSIRDNGIGGARFNKGARTLMGLNDRVEALGGRIHISSAAGSGTSLVVRVPFEMD
jgi:signal transduction histidine kinase